MAFTRKHAKAIANKLGAIIKTRRKAHDLAVVVHDDKLIASFGIRRASKEVGHDHIPSELGITYRQCRDLAQCPMTRDEYFQALKIRSKA